MFILNSTFEHHMNTIQVVQSSEIWVHFDRSTNQIEFPSPTNNFPARIENHLKYSLTKKEKSMKPNLLYQKMEMIA